MSKITKNKEINFKREIEPPSQVVGVMDMIDLFTLE